MRIFIMFVYRYCTSYEINLSAFDIFLLIYLIVGISFNFIVTHLCCIESVSLWLLYFSSINNLYVLLLFFHVENISKLTIIVHISFLYNIFSYIKFLFVKMCLMNIFSSLYWSCNRSPKTTVYTYIGLHPSSDCHN